MDIKMRNKKPIRISQCLTITSQGVLDDYVNAWASIAAAECLYASAEGLEKPLSLNDKKEIKRILSTKIQSYSDYIFNTHGEEILRESIRKSDTKTFSALNKLADSYNIVREQIAEDINFPIAMKFVYIAVFLIRGDIDNTDNK